MYQSIATLNPNEVHIWKYQIRKWKKGCLSSLSDEERSRLARFHSEENKRRFAQTHAFLRKVLERYTGIPAAAIGITKSKNGKPRIESATDTPVHFNLSYRGDYALVAVSTNDVLGIDIESVKKIDHVSSFVSAYFSYEERQKVLGYRNKYDRMAMVFTLWVMKEAFIKAKALHLSESIKFYNLCPFLESPECVLDFDTNSKWHIAQFQVADNYKAACAVRAGQTYFKMYDYNTA